MATKEEVDYLRARLAIFENQLETDMNLLKSRVSRIEEKDGKGNARGGDFGRKRMHAKKITPKDLDNPEDWNRWRADVED